MAEKGKTRGHKRRRRTVPKRSSARRKQQAKVQARRAKLLAEKSSGASLKE